MEEKKGKKSKKRFIILVIIAILWFATPFGMILKGLFRSSGSNAMERHLELKYAQPFTYVEGSEYYSSPGEICLDPTKGTWSAKYTCKGQPYYYVTCTSQLRFNRISYRYGDDYKEQLARYKYRNVMMENIKGIFPEGSYVWIEYSPSEKKEKHGGYFVSVYVEDMSIYDARKAAIKLKDFNASQGLYPEVSVRKYLGGKEALETIMTEDPKYFSPYNPEWNEEMVKYM